MNKIARSLLLAALSCLPAYAAPEALSLARADGSLIHYTLDRPAGPSAGLLLLSQGSGCNPGATSASLAAIRSAFAGYTALIVEKIGISPDSNIVDGNTDCPVAFVDNYTFSQRLDDYRAVLDHLRDDGTLSGPLVLFGGSEGGLAVAALAAELHPAATILLSSATGVSFGEMVRSTVPPEGHPTIDAGFAAARAEPDSTAMFAGHTYRFWADILDRRTLDYMRRTTSPFLLIQGGRDTLNPVAAARSTADSFAEEGRCHLTYWEFPTLDHSMQRPDGASRLEAIGVLAARWVESPAPAC
jgi:pimeloyl-ACP methyl ester carboxylesterase